MTTVPQASPTLPIDHPLVRSVDQFIRQNLRWHATPGTPESYDFWREMDALARAIDHVAQTETLPPRFVELAEAAAALVNAAQEPDEGESDALPENRFAVFIDFLKLARGYLDYFVSLPPLETLDELNRQKVSDYQVALIWGLKNRLGEPDVGRVMRERQTPGGAEAAGWQDPRLDFLQQQMNERLSLLSESPLALRRQAIAERSRPRDVDDIRPTSDAWPPSDVADEMTACDPLPTGPTPTQSSRPRTKLRR